MKARNLILTIVLLTKVVFAQEVGEIFDNSQLDNLFGKVLESDRIETKKLNEIISFAGDFIMFRIIDGAAVILNQDRIQLYPEHYTANFNDETVFKFFSVSVLERLLESAENKFVIIEEREKSLVVKYKEKAMERGGDCPPHCPIMNYANTISKYYIYDGLGFSGYKK